MQGTAEGGRMILVTGGAGYVGSHALREIRRTGEDAVVLDDLSEGHREAVGDAPLVEASLADRDALHDAFAAYPIDAVLHFAASCYVGESVTDPAKYYAQNVVAAWNLLEAVREAEVPHVIFSSSAAVYGQPDVSPIPETAPRRPINPYGRTKSLFEDMLADYERAYGVRWTALRYFNASGADPSGEIGEDHEPETHLLPLILQAIQGKRAAGHRLRDRLPTPDGSCVRDYVHVNDLATAHVLALRRLREGGESRAFNLGLGRGSSVLEAIEAAGRVTKRDVPHVLGERRPGDPATLVADPGRAGEELGWTPRFTELDEILATAWAWHESRPDGYGDRAR
jgi:UDP-glucose 4-epimerase